MNIKVCGITQLKQLQQLDGLEIDFAGLIFYKKSSRYVGDKINKKDLQHSDFDLKKVGVFVNADYDSIFQTVEDYGLDVVQLHGDETPEFCERISEEVEVIKAFKVGNGNESIDEMLADYDEVCDYYLFDSNPYGISIEGAGITKILGGTGEKFDWDIINKAKIEKPFFLSGGIDVDDVLRIKAFKHPDMYAVDINSRFEKEPGLKDMALILKFRQGFRN